MFAMGGCFCVCWVGFVVYRLIMVIVNSVVSWCSYVLICSFRFRLCDFLVWFMIVR